MIYRSLFLQDAALMFRSVLLLTLLHVAALNVFYMSSWDSTRVLRESSANDTLIVRLDEPGRMYTATASILYVDIRGCITFGELYSGPAPTSLPWNTLPVISAYWTDSLISDRELSVGIASDSNTLKQFSDDVELAFPAFNLTLSFSNVYIATWNSSKSISFQCVLSVSEEYFFAVLQYENSKVNSTPQPGVIGFDDGHDNYWSPNINTVEVANTVGNLPLHSIKGKYVLDLKKSACSPLEWSSNNYCSFDQKCVANNYDENCEGCLVSQSRFTRSQLQCDPAFYKTNAFWIAIGVALLGVFLLAALIYIVRHKSKQGSFRPEVEGNIQSNGEEDVDVSKYATNPLDSNILAKSKSQRQGLSFPKVSHRQSTGNNTVAEQENMISDRKERFSPQVDEKSPPVSLAWIVGKKATTIEIHELTLTFPAKCLKREKRINISVRRYIHKEDPVYVYTVTPHELVFDKPVTLHLNSKWKDSNSAFLRKRKSHNDDWITVGTFANEKGVSMYEFCDMCPTYKERTAEFGKGFSFNNVSVAAQRDSQFVTLEVNLLADACNDTLQSQREIWKEKAGSRLCGLSAHEILLYEKGEITSAVLTDETTWKTIGRHIKTLDFGSLKLGGIRNLLTCHLRPAEGLSVQEAISRGSPCQVNVKFAESCPKPGHTDDFELSLLFGDRNLDDDVRGGFFKPITESETVQQHASSDVPKSTSGPPTFLEKDVTFPADKEKIEASMVATDILLPAICSLVDEEWEKLAKMLLLTKRNIEQMRSITCNNASKCNKVIRKWISTKGEDATVGNLITICDFVTDGQICKERIRQKFLKDLTTTDV